jgi:hypothetical protein
VIELLTIPATPKKRDSEKHVLSWNHVAIALGLGAVISLTGCGRATPPRPSNEVVEIFVPHTSFHTPVSQDEVALFLNVIRHLPNEKTPQFAELLLPSLTATEDLPEQIRCMQQDFRNALQPKLQASFWKSQPDLESAFAQINVDPEAFAKLTLRISTAWTALTVAEETRSREVRLRLRMQIDQLVSEIETKRFEHDDHHQQLRVLEELVALSEFLSLLDQVPEDSLKTVERFQGELRQILPHSPSHASRALHRNEHRTIQPVKFEQ